MKFTTREDIEAPLAFVYAALADFEGWETAAMRRGADVQRLDARGVIEAGSGWKMRFNYRGKVRRIELRVTEMVKDQRLAFAAASLPAEAAITIELTEMGQRRTRLAFACDLRPLTLAARLMVQSLRFARGKVQRRLDQRATQFRTEIEDRYRAQLGR